MGFVLIGNYLDECELLLIGYSDLYIEIRILHMNIHRASSVNTDPLTGWTNFLITDKCVMSPGKWLYFVYVYDVAKFKYDFKGVSGVLVEKLIKIII